MTTMSHEPSPALGKTSQWSLLIRAREMWASLAIIFIWLAVLFDAVYGPSIDNSSAGGDHSSVPSAVAVALFASIATWAVAKYGFRRDPGATD